MTAYSPSFSTSLTSLTPLTPSPLSSLLPTTTPTTSRGLPEDETNSLFWIIVALANRSCETHFTFCTAIGLGITIFICVLLIVTCYLIVSECYSFKWRLSKYLTRFLDQYLPSPPSFYVIFIQRLQHVFTSSLYASSATHLSTRLWLFFSIHVLLIFMLSKLQKLLFLNLDLGYIYSLGLFWRELLHSFFLSFSFLLIETLLDFTRHPSTKHTTSNLFLSSSALSSSSSSSFSSASSSSSLLFKLIHQTWTTLVLFFFIFLTLISSAEHLFFLRFNRLITPYEIKYVACAFTHLDFFTFFSRIPLSELVTFLSLSLSFFSASFFFWTLLVDVLIPSFSWSPSPRIRSILRWSFRFLLLLTWLFSEEEPLTPLGMAPYKRILKTLQHTYCESLPAFTT